MIFGFHTSGLALATFAPLLVRSIVCFDPTFACCAPTTTGDLVLVMTEVCFAIDIEFWVGLDLPPKLVKLACCWAELEVVRCSELLGGLAIDIEF